MIEKYGILGEQEAVKDEDGYIEMFVVIEERGLYAGAPPEELRITEVVPLYYGEELIKEVLEERNKRKDLPLYLAKAKIKVIH